MSSPGTKLAVIIPFFNGAAFLDNLLDSIRIADQEKWKLTLILVDNSPTEKTIPEKINQINTHIIRSNIAIGFGRACNIGADWARKNNIDYLLFMNQDAELEFDFLSYLFQLKTQMDLGNMVFPLIFETDNRSSLYKLPYSNYFYENHLFHKEFEQDKLKNFYPLKAYTACTFAVGTEVFFKSGLFDIIYHMYGEDYDLFWRASKLGYGLKLFPALTIYHPPKNYLTVSEKINYFRKLWRSNFINILRWKRMIPELLYPLKQLYRLKSIDVLKSVPEMFKLLVFTNKVYQTNPEKIKKRAEKQIKIDLGL